MAVYMVDRELPGATTDLLAGPQRAAIETSEQFTASRASKYACFAGKRLTV